MKIKLQDRTTGVTHTGRQRCCHFLNNTVRPHSIKEVSSEKTEMEITFLESIWYRHSNSILKYTYLEM